MGLFALTRTEAVPSRNNTTKRIVLDEKWVLIDSFIEFKWEVERYNSRN
jgi:hypothetical protein